MSYGSQALITRQVAQAARLLDHIDACKTARLQDVTAEKIRLVVDEMQKTAQRFKALVSKQDALSEGEFFAKALEHAQVIRQERAALARYAREKREREAAQREELRRELALIAA